MKGKNIFKVTFLMIFLIAPIVGASAYTSPSEENLFYRFNESLTPAIDYSDNNYDGIWNGGITSGVTGISKSDGEWDSGEAYNFDGFDDYINVASNDKFQNSSGFSFSIWTKIDGTVPDSSSEVIIEGSEGNFEGWTFSQKANDQIAFEIFGSSTTTTTVSTPNDNDYHHYVGTYDGSNIYLYKDSNLEDSSSGPYDPSTGSYNLSIGYSTLQGGEYFAGSLDEPRFFDKNLTSQEVSNLNQYNQLTEPTSTNVTISNFQPSDGSTYAIDQDETITADISVESNEYNTVDVEGIFDGNIETVKNVTADGSTNTVSFTKDFSNEGTGTYNYWFNILADSPSGDTIDSTEIRNLTVESDPVTFDLKEPNDGEEFIRTDNDKPFSPNFKFDIIGSDDEDANFTMKTVAPNGSTTTQVDALVTDQNSLLYDTSFDVGNDYGTYKWYLNATGQVSGDTYDSVTYSFTINPESAVIKLIKPSGTATETFNYDFDSSGDVNDWNLTNDRVDIDNQLAENGFTTDATSTDITYDSNDQQMVLEGEPDQLDTDSNSGLIFKYENKFILEDNNHWFNSSFSEADRGYAGQFYGSDDYAYYKDSTSGSPNVKFEYDTSRNKYDLVYDDGSTIHRVESSYEKTDRIAWGIGVYTADFPVKSVSMDSVVTDADQVVTDQKKSAYVEEIPYEAEVSAETKNDGEAKVEFIHDGNIIETFKLTGDGTKKTFTHKESFSNTEYQKFAWANVLGTDGSSIESTSPFKVDVVQEPEFNLISPENDSRIEVEDESNDVGEDDTNYEGEITIGEAGKAKIQLQKPNSSFQTLETETYNRSDVGDIKTILSTERLQNITLNEKSDENVLISPNYNWKLVYDGSDSLETFNSDNNTYNYVSKVEGIVEIPFIFSKNISDRIKDSTGSTGQFFFATLIILIVAGSFHMLMKIPVVTIGSMTLLTLGFSLADGYYPVGVFWILMAIVGLAGAYFGSKVFGGGG